MIGSIIYIIGGFIEIILGLRFVLKLFGANPESQFVTWIYNWSAPFVAPFNNIFGTNATSTGTGTVTTGYFDWAALIALIVVGAIVAVIGGALARRRHIVA
jgi:hypothetical protein